LELELSELETVTRPGGVSGENDGDWRGSGGDASGEPGSKLSAGTAGCMLLFSATVKSHVTRRVLRGTTGVPKDCWLRRVASLDVGKMGGRSVDAVRYVSLVLFGTTVRQSDAIGVLKKVERCRSI
jgi:hypothetical protein